MALSDNQKIIGWAFFIIGILMLINTILEIWSAVDVGDWIYGITAIGDFIAAVVFFFFGNRVRTEKISGKLNVLGNYVRIVGIIAIIIGLFNAIAGAVSEELSFWGGVIDIIFGIIIAYCGQRTMDTSKSHRILWAVELVVFVIMFIASFVDIFTTSGVEGLQYWVIIISAICYAIVYLFMVIYLCDKEVRQAML